MIKETRVESTKVDLKLKMKDRYDWQENKY